MDVYVRQVPRAGLMLRRFGLPVLLTAFVLLGLAYSVITPLGEASDEVPHFGYIEYLVAHHELPPAEGAVLGEDRQPPLYYVIGALVTGWIPREDLTIIANPDFVLDDPQTPNLLLHTKSEAFPYAGTILAWHIVRLLSLALGAITVAATWFLARTLFPDDDWLALGAAAFVALLPSFLFLSASVNNDNLVIALTALSTLQVVSLARRGGGWRSSAWLGILLGLSVLAKWSGLVVWLFAGVVFLYVAFDSRKWKETAMHCVISFGVAVAILAPWSLDNLLRHGDPLGFSKALSTTELRQTAMTFRDWVRFTQSMYTSFWGRFGGVTHLAMSPVVYTLLGALGVPVVLGWIANARDAFSHRLNLNARALFALFAVFWLFLLASYLRWTVVFAGTNQIRLLFPGLPLFAIFAMAGIVRFFSSRRAWAVGLFVSGFLLLNLSVLFVLQSLFAPPPVDLTTMPKLGGVGAPADFGVIRVVDYGIDETQVAPGNSITVQFYWQALSNPPQDYWLLLQLADASGAIANKDGAPSAGRVTTDRWQAGETYESHHTLIVPADTPPGTYILRMGLHPFGTWEWLPVRGQEMLVLGRVTIEDSR